MNITNGRLDTALWIPSPNFGPRPDTDDISLLVIHNISLPPGQYGSGCVQRFFCNQLDTAQHPYFETIADLQVSSHLFIERDGAVSQFVSLNDRAWHAGQSQFCGRDNCNDYSIGIELEGTDTEPYTDAQYQQLAVVTEVAHDGDVPAPNLLDVSQQLDQRVRVGVRREALGPKS